MVARLDRRAAYSNFAVSQAPDYIVAGPGAAAVLACEEDIISTVPASAGGFCTTDVGTPGYDFYAGTSMATPHVAGVAALLTAQGRSRADVIRVLKQTARTPVTGAAARTRRPSATGSWTRRRRSPPRNTHRDASSATVPTRSPAKDLCRGCRIPQSRGRIWPLRREKLHAASS